jgi:hypothetical protein
MRLPELAGVVTAAQVRRTAEHIASLQQPDGLIPWFAGHHADPWDHIEAAMALSVAGLIDEARYAFAWSVEHQAEDGTWPMQTVGQEVRDSSVDTNQVAYIAAGVWHHWLITRDRRFVNWMWPAVRSAIDYAVELQQAGGAVAWSRDATGAVSDDALLTGSACVLLSLRCAVALADLIGDPRPDWELAAARLAHVVAVHPGGFLDKNVFSMDWYYPVLGGAVTGTAARDALHSRWIEFVVPGRGCRCVSDRPWVTAAETFELAMALDAVGDGINCRQVLRDAQFLRTESGGYWTGWVWPEDELWPAEQTSWTSAAMILAVDACSRTSQANGLFRAEGLPRLLATGGCDEYCLAVTGISR